MRFAPLRGTASFAVYVGDHERPFNVRSDDRLALDELVPVLVEVLVVHLRKGF
jgi:hypothetical protein